MHTHTHTHTCTHIDAHTTHFHLQPNSDPHSNILMFIFNYQIYTFSPCIVFVDTMRWVEPPHNINPCCVVFVDTMRWVEPPHNINPCCVVFVDTMSSVGILEMGGASTQIAFVPDTSVLADKFPITIWGERYPLYVHRYESPVKQFHTCSTPMCVYFHR